MLECLSKEKEEKNVKTEGNSEGQDARPVPEEVREQIAM